ncbi:MAG TPA: hypothetical protein VEF89_00255 [Solirubrobacteraceae bacterium]|nr:hypothetical protein [Solirubrobacteraceae bacterium]
MLLLILGAAAGGVAAGAQSRPLAADSAKLALSARRSRYANAVQP